MIDSKDVKTIDAFSPRGRGRKPTGNALTPAQRKAAQRARDKASVNSATMDGDYSAIGTTALLEAFADAVVNQYEAIAKKLSKELLKRSKLI